jgi:hypothetical protein
MAYFVSELGAAGVAGAEELSVLVGEDSLLVDFAPLPFESWLDFVSLLSLLSLLDVEPLLA